MSRPVDVEGTAITAMSSLGVPVSVRIPNPRPTSHIRVTRSGGARRNVVQSDATVLVECWAPTSLAAFDLAASAWDALDDIQHSSVNGVWVGSISLTEPVNFPDPDTSSPRYQFLATLRTGLNLQGD